MRVLLGWTDDISPNLGVRALGRGSQDFLRRIWPEAEFEYMNYGTRPASVSWSTRGLAREWVTNKRGMKDWLRSFDLYWDTRSGDSFADIYGMPRHTTMSLIHELAVRSGVPAVMAPQTIGPFGSRRARVLARRNLRRSRIVLARDPISAQASAALGRPVDLTTTDMVFGITQPEPASGYDVLLNVSGLLWNSTAHGSNIAYREQVHHIIAGLTQRGRSVTLLPHVLDSADPDNDVPVSRQIQQDLGGAVHLAVPTDLEDARRMIAGANLVIGARMHACLNALSTGTPTVAMAYSRKFAPLMAALEWPHVVSLAGDEAVSTRVLDSVDDPDLVDRALESQGAGQRLLGNAVPLLEALR